MSVAPAPGQPGDILIVDDTPANLRLLSQILSEHGYKARAVLNGPHALTAAQTAPPDLILLDVRMPNLARPRSKGPAWGYLSSSGLSKDSKERSALARIISAPCSKHTNTTRSALGCLRPAKSDSLYLS